MGLLQDRKGHKNSLADSQEKHHEKSTARACCRQPLFQPSLTAFALGSDENGPFPSPF
jgi:hypothetical protein